MLNISYYLLHDNCSVCILRRKNVENWFVYGKV